MQTANAKYSTFAARSARRVSRSASRPSGLLCVVALALVALPLPVFAETDAGENIAIAHSSNIVGGHDGFDTDVTHINFRSGGALLPAAGNYERFSLRYRMKVK